MSRLFNNILRKAWILSLACMPLWAMSQDALRTLQAKRIDMGGTVYEGFPVIELGGTDAVLITFDIIADDRDYLRYELIHCDSQWRPEGLVDSEFLDSFNEASITDYAFSQATLAHYVNYAFTIPNDQIIPTISGNYIVRIYNEEDPETTLATARFAISEQSAPVWAEATSLTDFDYNGRHQQLSIVVDTEHLPVNNPITDLRVVVTQDSRSDNAVTVTTPLRLDGTKAVFEHNRDLTFAAGNEYRRFEIINERYPTMGVEYISFVDPLYHYVLNPDGARASSQYLYDLSRYGRYLLRRQDSSDADTEADYAVVHFTLDIPYQPDYDIYIEGDLTGRTFGPENRMVWNPDTHCYEGALLLKQGAYSYQYLAFPRSGTATQPATALVEGDYYPTRHSYDIRVYYRKPGERFDRLGGHLTLE